MSEFMRQWREHWAEMARNHWVFNDQGLVALVRLERGKKGRKQWRWAVFRSPFVMHCGVTSDDPVYEGAACATRLIAQLESHLWIMDNPGEWSDEVPVALSIGGNEAAP